GAPDLFQYRGLAGRSAQRPRLDLPIPPDTASRGQHVELEALRGQQLRDVVENGLPVAVETAARIVRGTEQPHLVAGAVDLRQRQQGLVLRRKCKEARLRHVEERLLAIAVARAEQHLPASVVERASEPAVE